MSEEFWRFDSPTSTLVHAFVMAGIAIYILWDQLIAIGLWMLVWTIKISFGIN